MNLFEIKKSEKINKMLKQNHMQTKVSLWQRNHLNELVSFYAIVSKIDFEKDEIEFTPINKDFNFQSKNSLYFHSNQKNTIFKSSIVFNSNKLIISKVPIHLMMKESRKFERTFYSDRRIYVSFSLGSLDHFLHKNMKKARLINLSEQGVALNCESSVFSRLEVGDTLTIDLSKQLGLIVEARVRHLFCEEVENSIRKSYQLGLEFI